MSWCWLLTDYMSLHTAPNDNTKRAQLFLSIVWLLFYDSFVKILLIQLCYSWSDNFCTFWASFKAMLLISRPLTTTRRDPFRWWERERERERELVKVNWTRHLVLSVLPSWWWTEPCSFSFLFPHRTFLLDHNTMKIVHIAR